MDHTNIFAHTDPGGSYPEYLSVNEREGRVEVTVRAPRVGDREGPTATMTLPRAKVPDLVQALLLHTPPDELAEAKPVVLYFDSDEDAAKFVALVKQSKPGLRAVTR